MRRNAFVEIGLRRETKALVCTAQSKEQRITESQKQSALLSVGRRPLSRSDGQASRLASGLHLGCRGVAG
jgi:hypothetical protein